MNDANLLLDDLSVQGVKDAERFALFVEAVSAGIWDYDIETGEVWWSPKIYEILGYEPGDIASHYLNWINNILHPEDKILVEKSIAEHLLTGSTYNLEVRQLHKSGDYKWYQTQGQAKFDQDRKPIRMVGSIFDVNDRKIAQILQEKNEFLLEEMSAMSNIGAWEYHIGDASPKWSPQIYKIHGLEPTSQPDLDRAINFFIPEHAKIIRTAFEDGLKYGTPYDLYLQMILLDNTTIWVRTIGKPFFKDDGTIAGMRGVFQDVNEAKMMELERLETIKLLGTQNTRLQNFAHIVSHNLRSHASNMEMLTGIIVEEKDLEQVKHLAAMLKTTSNLLFETLNHLSDVVKTQNLADVQKVEINLECIFEKTLIILSSQIATQQVSVSADFKAFGTVMYDQIYGESLLLNLLSNAIKYGKPNEISEVKVYTEINEFGQNCLIVRDNGLGMDLDKIGEKLFGMYKTFHGNEDARGLGLFLTKNQVESMGGEITVESSPNVGSTFTIRFG